MSNANMDTWIKLNAQAAGKDKIARYVFNVKISKLKRFFKEKI